MRKKIKYIKDYLVVLVIGLLALTSSAITVATEGSCIISRAVMVVLGIGFVLLGGGYVLSTIVYPKAISVMERLIYSAGFSLFLTYPAGFLNVLLIEGQTDIYRIHIIGDLSILLIITMILMIIGYLMRKKKNIVPEFRLKLTEFASKYWWIAMAVILLGGTYLRAAHLGDANMNQDEFEIGYRLYDMVDGIQAGRRAYFLSAIDHAPLGFYIVHFVYNLLNPFGFYELSMEMIRIPTVIMGVLTMLGGALLAQKFFKNKWITLIFFLLLAVDSYSIFASRLTISQDLSYMSFFMILTMLGLYNYLENSTLKNALITGFFLGCAFLIKFSSLLLVPAIVLAMIFYKKKNSHIATTMGASIVVFLPVIVFNIGSYVVERYLDVPFSRIARLFGIETNAYQDSSSDIYGSVISNPLFNLYEMFFLWVDQFNLFMVISIIIAIFISAFLFFKNKAIQKPLVILWLWAFWGIVFFSINGFRAYYMSFLAVPFLLVTGLVFYEFWKAGGKSLKYMVSVLLIGLISYSTLYSYNTNLNVQAYDSVDEMGRTSYGIIEPEPFSRIYSLSSLGFLFDDGWEELQAYAEKNINKSDMMILDPGLTDLLVRWYLEVGDEVKRHYLGESYIDAYNYAYIDEWPYAEIEGDYYFVIHPHSQDHYATIISDEDEEIIYKENGTEAFIIIKQSQ